MLISFGTGVLVTHPELREVQIGDKTTYVTSFKLRFVERRSTKDGIEKHKEVFNFETWDTSAQKFCELAKKGSYVAFTARPQVKPFDNKVVFRLTEFNILPNPYYKADNETTDGE